MVDNHWSNWTISIGLVTFIIINDGYIAHAHNKKTESKQKQCVWVGYVL